MWDTRSKARAEYTDRAISCAAMCYRRRAQGRPSRIDRNRDAAVPEADGEGTR